MNENIDAYKTANKNANKRMTSIARRINITFWLKRFGDVLLTDLFIILLITCSFVYWRCEQLPDKEHADKIYVINKSDYDELEFIIKTEEGNRYTYLIHEFTDYFIAPGIILLCVQLLGLFFALFNTGHIRRQLRPLNELAKKAEAISSIPLDASKFEHLEKAISNVSPDAPDSKISTGDKDLQSIEVALNNLLYRMRETQKQQSRFVSDASHELRTPISVIQGYVNMLDRWGKEDESILEESIEALKHESEHMKELIEQLLFLARGDSGRNTLNYTTFDLNEVIKEVWEESLMIDEKHTYSFENTQGIAVDMDGNILNPPAFMNGDMAMIKQSVRIFVQNAAKYSDDGNNIKFMVRNENGKVSYVIQDEGIGMEDSEVVHIFERFYRSDEARNGETGGSGLGLSIAKWIIDAHDGTIDVLSRTNLGTRFTVAFKEQIIVD